MTEQSAPPHGPDARDDPPGPGTSAPSDGSWVVRHEEQLRVLTDTVVTGRVRIRKRAITEEQTFTVAVTREEVSIEQLEVRPGERDAQPGALPGEQVLEIVRYEERVVVTKQVVPVERIRVVRHVVTEPQIVRGVVRREVFDVEVDEDRTGPDQRPSG